MALADWRSGYKPRSGQRAGKEQPPDPAPLEGRPAPARKSTSSSAASTRASAASSHATRAARGSPAFDLPGGWQPVSGTAGGDGLTWTAVRTLMGCGDPGPLIGPGDPHHERAAAERSHVGTVRFTAAPDTLSGARRARSRVRPKAGGSARAGQGGQCLRGEGEGGAGAGRGSRVAGSRGPRRGSGWGRPGAGVTGLAAGTGLAGGAGGVGLRASGGSPAEDHRTGPGDRAGIGHAEADRRGRERKKVIPGGHGLPRSAAMTVYRSGQTRRLLPE